MNGIELIAAERSRQIKSKGWSHRHDDQHTKGELIHAAESYMLAADFARERGRSAGDEPPRFWPWYDKWWKPSPDPIRNLVKAGALIAAEIDRLQRQAGLEPGKEGE